MSGKIIVIPISIALIFIVLAFIHFYWAAFGIKKPELVFPINPSDKKARLPSPLLTSVVGFGLLFFGVLFLNQVLQFWSHKWINYIEIIIGSIFFIRAIGDFKYAGFFKSIKDTPFAKMDTKYYAPLCLLLSTLIAISVLLY